MKHGSLYKRYLSAAGYTLSSAVVTRGLLFVTSVMMARLLLPGQYGTYSVVISFFLALTPFAELRLDIALVKFVPELLAGARERVGDVVRSAYGLVLFLVLPATVAVAVSAGPAARLLYHRPEIARDLAWTAPLLVVLAAYQIGVGTLAGLQDFRTLAVVQGVMALAQLALMTPAAFYWKLSGALAAYTVSWTAGAILVLAVVARRLPRKGICLRAGRVSRSERPALLRFSTGYLLATVSWALSFWCGNAILTRFCGLESAALFSVAFSFGIWTLFLPGYFTNPSLPFLSEACATERFDEFRTIVSRNFRLVWLFAAPMAIFFTASSKTMIAILFGDKYASAWPAAGLLSLAAVFSGCMGVISQGFTGCGKVWQIATLNWLWIFAFGAGSWLLAASRGFLGVSACYLAATLLTFCVYDARARRFLRLANTGTRAALAVLIPAFAAAFAVARALSHADALLAGLPLALACAWLLWRHLLSPAERLQTLALTHRLHEKLWLSLLQGNAWQSERRS